jgi:hypothetical protein
LKPILSTLLLVAALPATAQQAPQPVAAATRPDIEFAADVHMDSVRFGSDPKARVDFNGGPRLATRHDVERGRLPQPVRAGTTYRDVSVGTVISATLLDPALDAQATVSPPPPEDTP